MSKLKNLQDSDCTECRLSDHAKSKCWMGIGPQNPNLMFVTHAPSDRCSEMLEYLLNLGGINPDKVYITHAVKCRPRGNTYPDQESIMTCSRKFLIQELKIIKPRSIMLCGEKAADIFFPNHRDNFKLNGTPFYAQIPGGCFNIRLTEHPPECARSIEKKENFIRCLEWAKLWV